MVFTPESMRKFREMSDKLLEVHRRITARRQVEIDQLKFERERIENRIWEIQKEILAAVLVELQKEMESKTDL